MNKKILIIIPVLIVIIAGFWFWQQSLIAPGYYGLPVVACVDPTKPVIQDFTFHLSLTINGKNSPLDSNIGHDPGNCLRSIHTNDSSGTVIIQSNNPISYNLKDFFNVWHKNFTSSDLMGYIAGNGHQITVTVNGKQVDTADKTVIHPNDSIEVTYQ